MTQAIIDPQDVLQFAARLKKFGSDTAHGATNVHARFHQLGATWRDQEYEKFAPEFEAAIRAVRRFVQAAEQYQSYLARKARKAQEYLDQR